MNCLSKEAPLICNLAQIFDYWLSGVVLFNPKLFQVIKINTPIHLLIIEDSPEDRADIRQMLLRGSDRRYRFTEAEKGAAGVFACREANGVPPDCVLLDYYLPDMDALEVLAELRGGSELPVCPVVVLTGSDVRVGRSVLSAGAQDYIGKSWSTPESHGSRRP